MPPLSKREPSAARSSGGVIANTDSMANSGLRRRRRFEAFSLVCERTPFACFKMETNLGGSFQRKMRHPFVTWTHSHHVEHNPVAKAEQLSGVNGHLLQRWENQDQRLSVAAAKLRKKNKKKHCCSDLSVPQRTLPLGSVLTILQLELALLFSFAQFGPYGTWTKHGSNQGQRSA